MPSGPSPPTPRWGAATGGSWTPPRWRVAAPTRRSRVRRWPGGPAPAGVPAMHAGSGLRLHLVCTLHGPAGRRRADRRQAADREVQLDLPAVQPHLVAVRPGQQLLVADKHDHGREVEGVLAEPGVRPLRPTRTGQPQRPGVPLFKPPRQPIESVDHTFKGSSTLSATAVTRPVAGGFGSWGAPWPDRRDLAPPPDRPGDPAVTGRPRPLTPWNHPSSRPHPRRTTRGGQSSWFYRSSPSAIGGPNALRGWFLVSREADDPVLGFRGQYGPAGLTEHKVVVEGVLSGPWPACACPRGCRTVARAVVDIPGAWRGQSVVVA